MNNTNYVLSVLKKDEKIISVAKVTKWILLSPFLGFVISLFLTIVFFQYTISNQELNIFLMFGPIFLLGSIKQLVGIFIYILTTEMVLTSNRIIYKTGLIQRDTIEIPRKQIESINLKQTILGRIFKFGDIDVIGTGGTNQYLKSIANVISFRKSISGI